MAYVTPLGMLYFGDTEIAQRAFQHPAQPDGALLRATIQGDDRSAWTPEQQADGDAAMQQVQDACDKASKDTEKLVGASVAIPLSTVYQQRLHGDILNIARFWLYDDNSLDEVRYRYEQSVAFLEKIGMGEINLDADDTGGAGAGSPQYWSPGREFTNKTLSDYNIL